MFLYDEFKNMYYKEHERKDKHNSKIGIVLTLYSIYGVGISCITKNLNDIESIKTKALFIAAIIATIYFFIFTVFYGIKSFFGYKYDYIPTPKELDLEINKRINYYNQNKEYFEKNKESIDKHVGDFAKNMMYKFYRDSTTNNIYNNDKKVKYFNICISCISIMIIITLFCYILSEFTPKEIPKVQITNTINTRTEVSIRNER